MRRSRGWRPVLGAAAVGSSLLAPAGASVLSASVALSSLRTASYASATAEQLLVGLAAAACALLCAHLFLLVAAGVIEGVRRSSSPGTSPTGAAGRLPGRAVRVAVATLVMATLTVPAAQATASGTVSPVATAAADPAPRPDDAPPDQPVEAPVPGSWAALSAQGAPQGFVATPGPPAPATADIVTAPQSRAVPPEAPAPVVVVAGSSLWSIAAEHLGPGATDTEIAESWPRWWQANRDVIGDDPHLLLPGQQLHPPDARPAATADH